METAILEPPKACIAQQPDNAAAACDSTIQPCTDSTARLASLDCLAPLPGELPRAYAVFMRWALADPPPLVNVLADYNQVSRQSIARWKRIYAWERRRASLIDLRLRALASTIHGSPFAGESASQPAVNSPPPVGNGSDDFRSHALTLARTAVHRWQASDDGPLSLPGVTRVLELALKLTGQDKPNEPVDETADEFLANVDKACGNSQPATPSADPECLTLASEENR